MTDKPNNRIILGRLVHAFIRAGWNPPRPSTRITRHILEDMLEGRDPMHGDTSIGKATLDLSPRQRTVLWVTAMGMNGPDAAQSLGISHETLREILKKTRARLGARTTAHAVTIALRKGIIDGRDRPPGRHKHLAA